MQNDIKFGLQYKLIAQVKNESGNLLGDVEIPTELTCDFEIKRSYQSTLNKSYFKITNLSLDTRAILAKDRFRISQYTKMSFYFGYKDALSLAFTGNIQSTESYDQGMETITEIEAVDGAFLTYNTNSNFSLSSSATYKNALDRLVKNMTDSARKLNDNFSLAPLGTQAKKELSQLLPREKTFSGNTWQEIKNTFGDVIFIDNNTLHYLPIQDKVEEKTVFVLSAETGLLGTPKVSNAVLIVDVIAEPTLKVGDIVELRTTKGDRFSGKQYKVYGISHKGDIGLRATNKVTTTLELYRYGQNDIFNIL